MSSKYGFVEYSSRWPDDFQAEVRVLAGILGEVLIEVHHIGSTSVPGLAAKPIIDVLPIVRSVEGVDERSGAMERAGYVVWGECGLAGRRYFTKDRDGFRTHNVHVYQEGDGSIDRHLAFGAYLRGHADVREEYAALKRRAFALHPDDIAAYNGAKDAWIKRTERLALEWWRARR